MKKPNRLEAVAEPGSNGDPVQVSASSYEAESGRQDPADVRLPSVLVGRVVAIRNSHEPLVDFPSNTSGELVPARSLVPVTDVKIGHEAALVFEDGDPARPIIVGLIQAAQSGPEVHGELKPAQETLVMSAKKEVVIQCGKASITLTSAGKVLIRGAYLLSRSSGVNRIKGGSVQIN